MANRFRLVQQPIASLVGEDRPMFDLVVRMLDETGQEVLPSEFLAAAERTDLMKNIDRWIVGAAMSFCAAKQPHRVFVRLSNDSMRDQTLGTWLQQQLKASGVDPSRIVIELTEEMAHERSPRKRARCAACCRHSASNWRSSISARRPIPSRCSHACRSTTSRSTAR